MAFHVGQKVVCIGGKHPCPTRGPEREPPAVQYPVFGQVYTVRAIDDYPLGTLLRLNEVSNAHLIGYEGGVIEPGFNALAFRPVKTTSIEIFQRMLSPLPQKRVKA